RVDFAQRPRPTPPLRLRPTRLSLTEVETLRRDPYAVYARRVLKLDPLDPLLRDPGAAERGTLFHDILHGFALSGAGPSDERAEAKLVRICREKFDGLGLPPDIEAVWWPRFTALAAGIVAWERSRPPGIRQRLAEARAAATAVGLTGVSLSGY